MTNIKSIIEVHRGRMVQAGLLRQAAAAKLSPKVAAMRPSLMKAKMALQERQPDVQPSPMAILFETTLPKIEHVLVDLGEERAEQIVSRLCDHGQAIIKERGIEGSKEHLEGLFRDLAELEAKLREVNGVEDILELYRQAGREEAYLRLKLGDKIKKLEINDEGEIISLWMAASTTNSDLVHLQRVTSLRELHLRETRVRDISPLSGLTSLQELDLRKTWVSDLSPLNELTSLQKLHLEETWGVSDLSPLSGLTNLQELNLWGNRVSDISPLSGLTSLQELNLWRTQVSDLSPLSGLNNLQALGLWGTQVSDISPLSGLTSLQKLHLGGTQVSDLSPLSGLTSLQELHLEETQVSDISPLSGLSSLQELNLWRIQVSYTQVEELKRAIPGLEIER